MKEWECTGPGCPFSANMKRIALSPSQLSTDYPTYLMAARIVPLFSCSIPLTTMKCPQLNTLYFAQRTTRIIYLYCNNGQRKEMTKMTCVLRQATLANGVTQPLIGPIMVGSPSPIHFPAISHAFPYLSHYPTTTTTVPPYD